MMKRSTILLAVIILAALAIASCGGGGANSGDEVAVPAEYAGNTNPHAGDAAAADAGMGIYTTNCASCHGDGGNGDGPAGAALDPVAADVSRADLNDDYFYWRIAEGGAMEPWNSSMPAWKGILSEDDIWNTITYLRTLE